MAASAASADGGRYYDGYQDNGYYGGGDNNWRYQQQDYGNYSDYSRQRDWDNGGYGYNGGYAYGHDIVSLRWIVRNLRQQGFSYISRPALAGRFYQVKARDPNGHKVKLYIDAYSGRIVKVKG